MKRVKERKNKMIRKCIGTAKKVTIPLRKVGTAKNSRYEIIKEKKKRKTPEDTNRQKAINFEHKRNVIPSYEKMNSPSVEKVKRTKRMKNPESKDK